MHWIHNYAHVSFSRCDKRKRSHNIDGNNLALCKTQFICNQAENNTCVNTAYLLIFASNDVFFARSLKHSKLFKLFDANRIFMYTHINILKLKKMCIYVHLLTLKYLFYEEKLSLKGIKSLIDLFLYICFIWCLNHTFIRSL